MVEYSSSKGLRRGEYIGTYQGSRKALDLDLDLVLALDLDLVLDLDLDLDLDLALHWSSTIQFHHIPFAILVSVDHYNSASYIPLCYCRS
jgi:hypothetical protein